MRELLEQKMGARLVGEIDADVIVSQDGYTHAVVPGTKVQLWWSNSSNIGYMMRVIAEETVLEMDDSLDDQPTLPAARLVHRECWIQGWPRVVRKSLPTPPEARLPVQAGRAIED